MSRAFVDESASQSNEGDVPERKIPLPPEARNYVTPEGAERLRAELQGLLESERPRAMAQIARLSSAGNADPGALAGLRRRLGEIDRKIEYLSRMAAIAEVVDPLRQRSDRVVFGAAVTVRDDGGGERTYRIVGVDESDPEREKISWVSPVARALTILRIEFRA